MAHLEAARTGSPGSVAARRVALPALPGWWSLLVAVPLLLALWEALARAAWIPTLYFPAPSVIASTTSRLFRQEDLAGHTLTTISHFSSALALGGIPAVLFGWLMGWSRRVRAIGDPIVAAVHPLPKVALLPLIMVVFGIGRISLLLAISLSVFFPLVINSMTGVKLISPLDFEVAQNLGASKLKVFTRIVVPGSLPFVMAGVRLAVNSAFHVSISVELLASHRGLGAVIWQAWETFRPEEIYAGLFVLAVLGIVTTTVVRRVTARLVPWRATLDG